MKNKFSGNKGITLLALIITIIVMLILAGVSISMVVGEDGILTQAQIAKEKQDEAELKERIQLASEYNYSGDNVGKVNLQKTRENIKKLNIDGITFIGSTDTVLKVQYYGKEFYEFSGVNGASVGYTEYPHTTRLEDLFEQNKKFNYSNFVGTDALYDIIVDYKNKKVDVIKFEDKDGNGLYSDITKWEGKIEEEFWVAIDGQKTNRIEFTIFNSEQEKIRFDMRLDTDSNSEKYKMSGRIVEIDGTSVSPNSSIWMTEK